MMVQYNTSGGWQHIYQQPSAAQDALPINKYNTIICRHQPSVLFCNLPCVPLLRLPRRHQQHTSTASLQERTQLFPEAPIIAHNDQRTVLQGWQLLAELVYVAVDGYVCCLVAVDHLHSIAPTSQDYAALMLYTLNAIAWNPLAVDNSMTLMLHLRVMGSNDAILQPCTTRYSC
jgi:hypothetical protein